MAGYWQTWALPGSQALPLLCVPKEYTDVIIAFVAPNEEGAAHFIGPKVPEKDDISRLQQHGRRVLLSIGGGGVTVTLDTPQKVRRFSDSLYHLIMELCVSGVDIDVEQGMPAIGSPCAPEGTVRGLIECLDRLLRAMPPGFQLTLAPETANLVGGISRFGGAWGNYLPLLLHFGERVSRIHMQYYNSGPMIGCDGEPHQPGTVSFLVSLTDAIVNGFPVANTGIVYPGFPAEKVRVGLPASPQAARNGYMAPELIRAAFHLLRSGLRPWVQKPMQPYRHFGGLMTWSIQWDQENDYRFLCENIQSLQVFC